MTMPETPGPGPPPGELLELARATAREAGEMLADRSGRAVVVSTKSSPTDIVTEMDRAAERLIRDRIGAQRPEDAILGEEGGQTGEGALVRWVVDPLDGTVNYLYGLPDWAVSIAAEVSGEIVAGAICVPRRDALYYATLGGGAWRVSLSGGESAVGQALACNTNVPLERALIATGFGYDPGRRTVQGQVVGAVLPRVRDIRRNGACAVDLCSLAAGQVDGYYERGVQYWDIAAGSLIAREAGAIVAGLAGKPAGSAMTVGGGPVLFTELHDLLLSLRPERDAS
ncbi:MAG TPA: inositol monophosphatase family protein [Streptosporangiaceae bacterium]|jgi:myo-inositol-1(or 4)-monophosphatase|nr:inositol monophosphatase family protein [Streptosporangiaceae bacterium]